VTNVTKEPAMNRPNRPAEADRPADGAPPPSAAEAAAAVRTLMRWAGARPRSAPESEPGSEPESDDLAVLLAAASGLPGLSRAYPAAFRPDADYLAALPDLQNGPESLIRGARVPIQEVGVAGFRLPVRYVARDGAEHRLETAVTGTVALDARQKGINMSRILRSFYREAEAACGFALIDRALEAYERDLASPGGRLLLRFGYPMLRPALRSGLAGWQYYATAFEGLREGGRTTRILHLDYVYSSTCPCSLELAEHARRARGQLATPHSQRSVARISATLPGDPLAIEDLVDLCAAALPTETQVIVKREDEQAFAELNAANPVFVEDAARLLAERLEAEPRIGDFRVAASHQESLHNHDAVSILTRGPTFAGAGRDPRLFDTLRHGA